jgi:tetratricopeptide (TPR) repeat protein
MKKKLTTLIGVFIMSLFLVTAIAQDKTMTWTTKSKKAKELARKGAEHMKNIEFPQAYEYLKQALALDPEFTVALVLMESITNGETKKAYAEKAIKSAANKTEGEKLFASTVAPGHTAASNRPIWAKLQKMFPDGKMIGLFYVFNLATPAEQLPVVEDYLKRFPDEAAFHNLMGYLCLQVKKDTAAAKTHFEKYISLYPDGYNPYDSMGEFYFLTGDLANSEKYYNMTLDKYPFTTSAIDKLKEIKTAKEKNVAKEKATSN